jgi:hypothetical protein
VAWLVSRRPMRCGSYGRSLWSAARTMATFQEFRNVRDLDRDRDRRRQRHPEAPPPSS